MTTKAEYKKIYDLVNENYRDAPQTLEIYVVAYLKDEEEFRSKNVILNCLADYRYEIKNQEIMDICLKFMHSDIEAVRNSAVRALFMGGEIPKKACLNELKFLKEDTTYSILNYIDFGNMMGM